MLVPDMCRQACVVSARCLVPLIVAVLVLSATGCGDSNAPDATRVANPAAGHCTGAGGVVSGPEPLCELPDGTVVDAWDFFRAHVYRGGSPVNPAADFCEQQGGVSSGPEPLCELPDGTVVAAWEYFRSENGGR